MEEGGTHHNPPPCSPRLGAGEVIMRTEFDSFALEAFGGHWYFCINNGMISLTHLIPELQGGWAPFVAPEALFQGKRVSQNNQNQPLLFTSIPP